MKRIEGEWRYFDEDLNIPYPWYTKPCLEWLKILDLKGKRIFEYGVGDSTWWYREKGGECYGVDSNKEWAIVTQVRYFEDKPHYLESIVNAAMGEPLEHYPKQKTGIHDWKSFDIVIIDGLFRDDCTYFALMYLKPGGYLIIDNYKQPSVEEHWPLTEKLIEGMPITIYKEPGHQDWQTAVITKP